MNPIDKLNIERPRLIKYLVGLGCSYHNAEDIIQNIYIRVLGGRCNVKNSYYFYTAAKHGYIDLMEKHRREILIGENSYFSNIIVADNKEWCGETNNVLNAINTLPKRTRVAITMRYWYDKSRKEIGKELGLTDGGVKNLIQRGKKKIKQILEQEKIS